MEDVLPCRTLLTKDVGTCTGAHSDVTVQGKNPNWSELLRNFPSGMANTMQNLNLVQRTMGLPVAICSRR